MLQFADVTRSLSWPLHMLALVPAIQTLLHGYNFLYGSHHCKSYSSEDVILGELIREIRCSHYCIPNFSSSELDFVVLSACTY